MGLQRNGSPAGDCPPTRIEPPPAPDTAGPGTELLLQEESVLL